MEFLENNYDYETLRGLLGPPIRWYKHMSRCPIFKIKEDEYPYIFFQELEENLFEIHPSQKNRFYKMLEVKCNLKE